MRAALHDEAGALRLRAWPNWTPDAAPAPAPRALDVEADYVELFDRGRGTALHLFEHVHGDSAATAARP
jgi:nitrate reductase delta subunit